MTDVSVLDATREMSRSAHRWRDRAQQYYVGDRHGWAKLSKRKKEDCYALKERGIVAMHRSSIVRDLGTSPQGMAVYSYADGDLMFMHSCLHPEGAERTPVLDHPEVLLVPAKQQRIRICDATSVLSALPNSTEGYMRSAPPRIARSQPSCYECGCVGHIARYCPDQYDNYEHYAFRRSAPKSNPRGPSQDDS